MTTTTVTRQCRDECAAILDSLLAFRRQFADVGYRAASARDRLGDEFAAVADAVEEAEQAHLDAIMLATRTRKGTGRG